MFSSQSSIIQKGFNIRKISLFTGYLELFGLCHGVFPITALESLLLIIVI